ETGYVEARNVADMVRRRVAELLIHDHGNNNLWHIQVVLGRGFFAKLLVERDRSYPKSVLDTVRVQATPVTSAAAAAAQNNPRCERLMDRRTWGNSKSQTLACPTRCSIATTTSWTSGRTSMSCSPNFPAVGGHTRSRSGSAMRPRVGSTLARP